MNTSLSEIAGQLKDALETAQKAHKALEDAKATLEPLETVAKQADNAVNVLMSQYQGLTMKDTSTRRSAERGGTGKKRGPRSLAAVVMTVSTRLLGEMHSEGKKKAAALAAATERSAALAAARGGELSDELKDSIGAKADSIWAVKK